MKVAICSSLNFTPEIKKLADELKKLGHQVFIPLSSERILRGEITLEQIKAEKTSGEFINRAIKYDSIRAYAKIIAGVDAILVANFTKGEIKNYIGGNSFLEMGFAHLYQKKIYLLNDIPEMIYSDEIKVMQPEVLRGDLKKIQ